MNRVVVIDIGCIARWRAQSQFGLKWASMWLISISKVDLEEFQAHCEAIWTCTVIPMQLLLICNGVDYNSWGLLKIVEIFKMQCHHGYHFSRMIYLFKYPCEIGRPAYMCWHRHGFSCIPNYNPTPKVFKHHKCFKLMGAELLLGDTYLSNDINNWPSWLLF